MSATARTTETAPGAYLVEPGLEYTDGYIVTVWWSDEDAAWLASCRGMACGEQIADGPSREGAVLALACSLAATCDAISPNSKL